MGILKQLYSNKFLIQTDKQLYDLGIINGNMKKEFDQSVSCNILNSEAVQNTFVLDLLKLGQKAPSKSNISKSFEAKRYLIMQIMLPQEGKYYKIEISVKDASQVRLVIVFSTQLQNTRRLISSTINKQDLLITPLHAKFPKIDHNPQIWKNMCIDVGELSEKFFSNFEFRQITRIEIHGIFKLRRVMLSRKQIPNYDPMTEEIMLGANMNNIQDIPDSLNFPRKCRVYMNHIFNYEALSKLLKDRFPETRNPRGNSSDLKDAKQNSPKLNPIGKPFQAINQSPRLQNALNKVEISSIGSNDYIPKHPPSIKQNKVFKAKDIIGIINNSKNSHYEDQNKDMNRSRDVTLQSLSNDEVYPLSSGEIKNYKYSKNSKFNPNRYPTDSVANNMIIEERYQSQSYDLNDNDKRRDSQMTIYKSQELKLPTIDQNNILINKYGSNHNIIPNIQVGKMRNQSTRYSHTNLKITNSNIYQNVSSKDEQATNIYKSNQLLPQIQTIDKPPLHQNRYGKASLKELDYQQNYSVDRQNDKLLKYSGGLFNNDKDNKDNDQKEKFQNRYKNKNFHQIMKDVNVRSRPKDVSEEMKGWDGSTDNTRKLSHDINSSRNRQESNRHIKNAKQEQLNSYQPTIVTTTKASIQIETTSSVINSSKQGNGNIQVLSSVKHIPVKVQKISDVKLPSINQQKQNSFNSVYANQHFNHQFNNSSELQEVNENWKHTESSIQEDIFQEQITQTANTGNDRQNTHNFNYGSPKIKYRESLQNQYNKGMIGMTTDNFDRLSLDLEDLISEKDGGVRQNLYNEDFEMQNTLGSNTYNQFDNILGNQLMKRDTFTPPFMRTKLKQDQADAQFNKLQGKQEEDSL
ncbi:UNKNOWN [Stylonychia lemnae]|uniref:CFA20 domain-containing protein n=1 Tax=Stylonychia lemnae TaxID=5949 RepID=A0A078AF62_STYLE|nr:UNKNOWN [Stylonychia lemnae]|eukprot:CDW80466.1 UNKNOWN [Stylonychia lemnae]